MGHIIIQLTVQLSNVKCILLAMESHWRVYTGERWPEVTSGDEGGRREAGGWEDFIPGAFLQHRVRQDMRRTRGKSSKTFVRNMSYY